MSEWPVFRWSFDTSTADKLCLFCTSGPVKGTCVVSLGDLSPSSLFRCHEKSPRESTLLPLAPNVGSLLSPNVLCG